MLVVVALRHFIQLASGKTGDCPMISVISKDPDAFPL